MEKILKPEYYDTLVNIRNVLKDNLPNFPEGNCEESSHLIYRVCFNKFKIDEVAGYYHKDDQKLWHSWNYDQINKFYIDISINQFSKDLPDILIVDENDYSNILQEDWEARENHWKVVLGAPFQKSIEKILNDFIELYPEKKDQIIM